MATPPTFVSEYEVASWTTNGATKTASVTTAVGDVLVAVAVVEDAAATVGTPTGGTSLTWSLAQSHTAANNCTVYTWTATATTAESFTFSATCSSNARNWGFNVLRFSGSDGIGASNKAQTSGAPSLALTTGTDNAAVVIVNGDWNAVDGTTRTWRTVNGSPATEQSYARNSAAYTIYCGYHPDAGAAGSKTVGLSAPTGQAYGIIAVEVKGSTATPVSNIIRRNPTRGLIVRGRR